MMQVLRFLFILLEVVVLFNLLIIVHELGHFLAARWRGLVIEKFGVWFGKPFWKKTINGVQYSLGSIPFGGFVALPQLAPMDIIEGKVETLARSSRPIRRARQNHRRRRRTAFQSPARALFRRASSGSLAIRWAKSDLTTAVGYVQEDSPAAKAGIQAGDKILEVDGQPVKRFSGMNNSVIWNVVRSEGETIPFKVERNGAVLDFQVVPHKAETRGWRRKSVPPGPDLSRADADHRGGAAKYAGRGRWLAKRRCDSRLQRHGDFPSRSHSPNTSRRIPSSRSPCRCCVTATARASDAADLAG